MLFILLMPLLCIFTLTASDRPNNHLVLSCYESINPDLAIRLMFRERTDELLAAGKVAPELHAEVTETIRTTPIDKLEHLLSFITQVHQQDLPDNA